MADLPENQNQGRTSQNKQEQPAQPQQNTTPIVPKQDKSKPQLISSQKPKTSSPKSTKTKALTQKPSKPKQQPKPSSIHEIPSGEFHKPIKANGFKIPKVHMYIILAVIILTILTFIFFKIPLNKTSSTTQEELYPKQGDSVSVWYIGRLENGTVFDTNKVDIAKQEGIYNENRTYNLFTFRIGSQEVVPGFEDAVKILKVNQTKTFTLSPEKAYGEYDEKKVGKINRTESQARKAYIQRQFDLPKTILEQQNIEYKGKKEIFVEPLKYDIIGENEENITLRIDAKKGDILSKFPYNYFDSEIVLVNKTDIGIELQAKKGDKFQTPIGEVEVVDITEEEIKTKLNMQVGGTLITQFGQVTVKEITENEIVLDSNHPLAGKTLIFEITLEKIN